MTENKFSGYFTYYISRVNDSPLLEVLNKQNNELFDFFSSVEKEKLDYAYAPEKWTVKEVIFHIIETEIIMMYRAIRIARGDSTNLPGYDENMMISNARVQEMNIDELLSLYKNTRTTTLFYFSHYSDKELETSGSFSNLTLDVKGLGYLMAGHADHHVGVLKERYL